MEAECWGTGTILQYDELMQPQLSPEFLGAFSPCYIHSLDGEENQTNKKKKIKNNKKF